MLNNLYNFFWKRSTQITVIFAFVPYLPKLLVNEGYQLFAVSTASLTFLLLGVIGMVTSFLVWERWMSPSNGYGKPFTLPALVFGSFITATSGLSSLLSVYEVNDFLYSATTVLSPFVTAVVLGLLSLELLSQARNKIRGS